MTDFVQQVYADMKPVDRFLLLVAKQQELTDLSNLIKKSPEDIALIKQVLQELEKEVRP